jgi:hypothetical protein
MTGELLACGEEGGGGALQDEITFRELSSESRIEMEEK